VFGHRVSKGTFEPGLDCRVDVLHDRCFVGLLGVKSGSIAASERNKGDRRRRAKMPETRHRSALNIPPFSE
jgi:hypothetical protein